MKKCFLLLLTVFGVMVLFSLACSAATVDFTISYAYGSGGISWENVSHASYYKLFFNGEYLERYEYQTQQPYRVLLTSEGPGSAVVKAYDDLDNLIVTSNSLTFIGSGFVVAQVPDQLRLTWDYLNASSYTVQKYNPLTNTWSDALTVYNTVADLSYIITVGQVYVRVVAHLYHGEDLISNIIWIPSIYSPDSHVFTDFNGDTLPPIPELSTYPEGTYIVADQQDE